MAEPKTKSLKFKVLFLGGSILILLGIILSALWLLTKDISDEELGPSPFQVDESKYLSSNEEFNKLIKIGESIIIYEDEEDGFKVGLKEEEENVILALNLFLKRNEGIIEKIDLNLIKNCMIPQQPSNNFDQIDPDHNIIYIHRILRLINYRITYDILSDNYEGAKKDILLLSRFCDELFRKFSSSYGIHILISIKISLNNNIGLLINKIGITEKQKFELLSIDQELISTESLIIAYHFEIKCIKDFLHVMDASNNPFMIEKFKFDPVYSAIKFQPNNTIKLLREMIMKKIGLIDEATNKSYLKLNDPFKIKHNKIVFLEKNLEGKKIVNEMENEIILTGTKVLECNNIVKLIKIGKKLLEYKSKMGYLPAKLSDLNIEPKMYTDIITGDSFLYSANKGILKSLGKRKEYWDNDLIDKDLAEKEFQDKLINSPSNGYVLYLK